MPNVKTSTKVSNSASKRAGRATPRARTTRIDTVNIGERLKALRVGKRLTIGRLGALAGVPPSTISKIENGQLRPSLVHAINLATALNENLSFLVGRYRNRPQPRAVVRAESRDTISYPDMALTLSDLSGQFLPGVLEARLGVLALGAHSGIDPMTHRGEELCYVIDGSIRYRIDEQLIDLLPHEYLQFKSNTRHSWENTHGGETRVLWVFSDGLSF